MATSTKVRILSQSYLFFELSIFEMGVLAPDIKNGFRNSVDPRSDWVVKSVSP